MSRRVIRTDIQSLIGGVSQQPASVRPENQCEVQDNAFSSPVDGLGKRQPTEFVANLSSIINTDPSTASKLSENSAVHWISREDGNRYLVVIDNNLIDGSNLAPIAVFDLADGTRMNVTGAGGGAVSESAQSYLTNSAPVENIRAISIADTTYILNKSTTCQMQPGVTDGFDVKGDALDPDWRSASARRVFLFLSDTNWLTRYAVRLTTKTGPLHPVLADWIDPPQGTADQKTSSVAWVKTFNGDYANVVTKNGHKDDEPPYDIPAQKFAGYQIATGQAHEILYDLWVAAHLPEPYPGSSVTQYHGGIKDVYDRLKTMADGVNSLFILEYRDDKRWPTHKNTFQIPGAGPVAMLELFPHLRTTAGFREQVNLDVVDDGGGSLLSFSDSVQRIDQLPLVCKPGHRVRITGFEDTNETGDDWYVEFVAANQNTGFSDILVEGHWKETAASLIQDKIDPMTMPHELERVADGAAPNGYRFELKPVTWADQLAGDKETNPNPHFIGRTIENMFFWRNRLGFLTGTHVAMSEADEYHNFWRTTSRQLLDSDPIDLDAGHDQVARLRDAVPLDELLIVFTDQSQFVVRGDPILSPKTASIRLATQFQNLPKVPPVTAERGAFFAYPAGSGAFSQVKQLLASQDTDSLIPFESSGQIPRYIEGEIREMAATSLESSLVARTSEASVSHVLYVHKWFDRGSDRLLSSWMRFLLGPGTEDQNGLRHTRILGMHFVDNDLYLLMHRYRDRNGTGTVGQIEFAIEKLRFTGTRQPDIYPLTGDPVGNVAKSTYRCLLDRRITDADCTITYDSTTEQTVIQLPYELQSDGAGEATAVVISRVNSTANAVPEGRQYAHTTTTFFDGTQTFTRILIADQDGSIKAALDDDTLKLFIGQSYTMVYQFSQIVLRERKANGAVGEIATGRYQMIRGILSYEDSGGMTVRVAPALHSDGTPIVDRDNRDYDLPPLEVGLGRSHLGDVNIRDGRQSFLIQSTPEKVRLIVLNDTPYPCTPKSLEIEGTYTRRSKSFRT